MWYTYSETGWFATVSFDGGYDGYVGYPDYEIVGGGSSPFEYANVGDEIKISRLFPGTIYTAHGAGVSKHTIDSQGYVKAYHQTLTSTPNVEAGYRIGEFVGSVRIPVEAYPDEKKGYIYVETYGDYIIMRDKYNNYYAYTMTTPEVDTPSSTFSARITDGNLVVTGDGSALILDNVLMVAGDASASVENDTLHVREVNA